MKQTHGQKASLIVLMTAIGVYFLAKWWATESQESGEVIGANIGAGILGLAAIAIGAVAIICWIVLFAVSLRSKR